MILDGRIYTKNQSHEYSASEYFSKPNLANTLMTNINLSILATFLATYQVVGYRYLVTIEPWYIIIGHPP